MATVARPYPTQASCGLASQPAQPPVHKQVTIIFLFAFIAAACESTPICFTDGNISADIREAVSGRVGIVYGETGNPVRQTPVRLITVDNKGNETLLLDTTVTDETGRFNFSLSKETNASVVVEAAVSSGVMRGFWAGGEREVLVHPFTQVLSTILFDITSSSSRTPDDFSAGELRTLTQGIFDLSQGSNLDLSNTSSLETFVRKNLGRKIARAAGGEVCMRPATDLTTDETTTALAFAPDGAVCPIGYPIHLFPSSTFQFDVRPDGSLCGGTGGGLPAMLVPNSVQLNLPGEVFLVGGSSLPLAGLTALRGGREVTIGPYPLKKPAKNEGDPVMEDPLQVSRRVLLPSTGDYARYLEIFSNTGASDRGVTIRIDAQLFTGNDSQVLTHDLSEGSPGISDRFLAVHDPNQNRPTIGFVFQDGFGARPISVLHAPGVAGGNINEVGYRWTNVTIPAGQTKTWLHYLYMTSSRSAAEVRKKLVSITEQPDMSGLNRTELVGLMNFTPGRGTIEGKAGSVVGKAQITAANNRTGESLTVTARRDGSFAVPLNTQTGDIINVTSTDNLVLVLVAP